MTKEKYDALPAPLELVIAGSDKVAAVACGTCKRVVLNTSDRMKIARLCCYNVCRVCGVDTDKYVTMCRTCQNNKLNKESDEALQRRRAKAVRIPIKDYEVEWLFVWDGFGHHDGYFPNVGELLEFCEDEEVDPPEEVWACKAIKPTLCAESVAEVALQQGHDGAWEDLPKGAIDELQVMLDKWCVDIDVISYSTDYSTLVDISALID